MTHNNHEMKMEGATPTTHDTIKWPDRSHRTLAEVWGLSAEEVKGTKK